MRIRFISAEKTEEELSIFMKLTNGKPLQNVTFYSLIPLTRHGLILYRITDHENMRAKHLILSLALLPTMMFIPHLLFILPGVDKGTDIGGY